MFIQYITNHQLIYILAHQLIEYPIPKDIQQQLLASEALNLALPISSSINGHQ
jgi:hypothetical protein